MLQTHHPSPFLKEISLKPSPKNGGGFPFSIPIFSKTFTIEISKPVTFLIGENGAGKSTFLEAIAKKAGLNLGGGNKNHFWGPDLDAPLSDCLKLSWFPKVSNGFFVRAESFFDFASYIDELAKDDRDILGAYGGKSLHSQSHGESFLALFKNQFWKEGIYLLDEPEAALSPKHQLSFLALLDRMVKECNAQFIIATHSPILLAYPGAEILSFDQHSIKPVMYRDTTNYNLTKEFLDSPERYFKHLLLNE